MLGNQILFSWYIILILQYAVTKEVGKTASKVKEFEDKKDDDDSSNKKPAESHTEDDYDTSQGYPILFPETHMMTTMKKYITLQPNVSIADVDDDETYEGQMNNVTNTTDDEVGKCSKSLNLLFLLDSSESVKYSNWKLITQFVKHLCNRFQLHSTRVGIIRYASEAEIALPLTQFNNTETRDGAIDDIFYKTGGTRTDISLTKAAEVLHAEEQRSQVLILVTDGPTNRLEINKNHFVEGKDLVEGPAFKLKEAGVALFCVGVEPDSETPEEVQTMKDEMKVIASEPTRQHLFMSDGYHELERKVELVSKAACVVNGAWSTWSEFSPCSVTCGYGTKVRMRTCTNPIPENNGADCTGTRVETEECDLGPCSFQTSDGKTPTTSVSHINTQTTETSVQPTKDIEIINNATIPLSQMLTENTTVNLNLTSIKKNDTSETEQNKNSLPRKSIVIRWFSNTMNLTTPVNGTSNTTFKKSIEHLGGCYEGLEELKLNDSQYNASSVYSHDTDDEYVKREYAAPNAKLNNAVNGGGWCAEHRYAATGDKNQYLQFDLGKQMTVDAVATQGSHLLENWVKSYNLRYSDDGISWEYYAKNPLNGNNDRTGVQRNILTPSVQARYIQLNPIEWNEASGPEKHDICMRAALYKCRDGTVEPQVKRGLIHSKFGNSIHEIRRGVILKEKETPMWSHYPGQKTTISRIAYNRYKRNIDNHKKGQKRILYRLRKMAKNIMRKMKKKVQT